MLQKALRDKPDTVVYLDLRVDVGGNDGAENVYVVGYGRGGCENG